MLTEGFFDYPKKTCAGWREIVFESAQRTLYKYAAIYAHGRGAGRAKRPEGLPAPLPRGERRRRQQLSSIIL